MFKRVLLFASVLTIASASAWAQQDPFLGNWKQNLAKSTYDPPTLKPKEGTTIKREAVANGMSKTTTDGTTSQGAKTHTEYAFKPDGKDYPVTGSQDYDTQSVRKIDSNTRVTVSKKGGMVTRMIRQTISKDGKTATNDTVGVNAQGQSYYQHVIYDKQ
jgi:hypothetical protein